MRIVHTLTRKPWTTAQGIIDNHYPGDAFQRPKGKLGLRFLIAVISIVFFLLVIAYGERMTVVDWRPAPPRGVLWLNTAWLILSSIGLQWARMGVRNDRMDRVSVGLVAGGVFAIAFLTGQLLAWRQLDSLPAFGISNPAIAFFYLITIAHALHMVGGLVAWIRTMEKVWRGHDIARVRQGVELCATYWHFLLVIWLILFGLLFSGNSQLEFLLKICGLK
ncbi:MAG TPA: cytochrome c oxidase subunit 3 [Alphaproteobacteria bacterium]|nr:cytochrome c oxidase subunit 3 [Alphaproteobacteria bacterium]